MTDTPNPAEFSVNDRPREYQVVLRVAGEIHKTIMADSQEDANAQADKLADHIFDNPLDAELDDIDEVEIERCLRARPMFRVMRRGAPMQVTHLEPGDKPREPDARGF